MSSVPLFQRLRALEAEQPTRTLVFETSPVWAAVAAMLVGDAERTVLRSCDDCGRVRVGETSAWRSAAAVRVALRRRGLRLPQRVTTCRDCLVAELPEYFTP